MELDPILTALAAALAGEGPAVELLAGPAPEDRPGPEDEFEDVAVIVNTSGSTGTPKRTALSAGALAASSMATAMALRGEGQWLLALPVHYVAGVQVLVRSLYAGTRPWAMDLSSGFTPEAFTAAAQELTDRTRFTSLVPTQLRRLLENPSPGTLAALRRFNAILLGGGPAPASLLEQARAEGLQVVTTYGMSETCGGCVYDGVPLEGMQVRLDGERILLGGDTVAAGYLGRPDLTAERFFEEDGVRWYRTEDLGALDAEGRLTVLGRGDDVIITGGLKVSAAQVQKTLEAIDGVKGAFVTGLPSEEWGQTVAAFVAGSDPTHVREAAVEALGPRLAPKIIHCAAELPLLPNGKPDRMAMTETLRSAGDAGH